MDIKLELKPPPFLKWAGGKRWLIKQESNLFPESFNTYLEPFLGSAAVFFHLSPEKAILSDLNQELINTYNALRTDWQLVQRYLTTHHYKHCEEYYYQIRASKPTSLNGKAARMIYLNRTCWNGLYRVNLKGKFNVPIGTKQNAILDTDNFERISKLLSKTKLIYCDFEKTINKAKKNDFVFVDPPYTVKHNYNGFIKYNETLFSWKDQERLKLAIDRAVQRGAKVLVLNAAHDSIRELYAEYFQEELSRSNVLSGKAEFRGTYEELAICCGYKSMPQHNPKSSRQDCIAVKAI